MNSITLMGNLTRDPEWSEVGESGVCNFGIAVNRKYKDEEYTTFVDLDCWGARGSALEKHFSRGDRILIQGRLDQDTWQDGDGNNRSKHKVTVNDWFFCDSKSGGASRGTASAGASNF